MENTEHYNLNLPDGEDIYNINDFNQNTEKIDDLIYDINEDIADMKVTFRAGVDACYDACVTKGSTPDSHALSDVVDAIYAIEGGGSGDPYSMFPQEVSGREDVEQCSSETTMVIQNNKILLTGHIQVTTDAPIKFKFIGDVSSYYTGTVTFSLLIDNTTEIANIGTLVISEENKEYPCSISYTLTTSLTLGYHTLSLMSRTSDVYYAPVYWPMANFYGMGFTATEHPGEYFADGSFINFIPRNFVVPTNPVVHDLEHDSSLEIETIVDAMNDNYSSMFDTGVSYNMRSITYYWEGCDIPVFPEIVDTLTYGNGIFTYHHPYSRSFSENVYEQHCFLLPIKGEFFKFFNYLNIRGHITVTSGSAYGHLSTIILKRTGQNTVAPSQNSDYEQYSLYSDESFIISTDVTDVNTNDICFIGMHFDEILTDCGEFTIVIDKIWGTSNKIGND